MKRVNQNQEKPDMGKVVEYVFKNYNYTELALVAVFWLIAFRIISAETRIWLRVRFWKVFVDVFFTWQKDKQIAWNIDSLRNLLKCH